MILYSNVLSLTQVQRCKNLFVKQTNTGNLLTPLVLNVENYVEKLHRISHCCLISVSSLLCSDSYTVYKTKSLLFLRLLFCKYFIQNYRRLIIYPVYNALRSYIEKVPSFICFINLLSFW